MSEFINNAFSAAGNWVANNPKDAVSAAVGLGGLALGGAALYQENRNAKRETELAEEAMAQQDQFLQQQSGNLAFQKDLLGRELGALDDQRKYLREQDDLNRSIAENERARAFEIYFQNNDKLQQERNYFVARQEFLDKQAAQERAEALGFMLQNQQIAQDEREFALQELRRAQQIAQGERDEELRQFYDNQYRAQAERQYAIDQYERAQGIAADERAEETRIRDALDGQLTMFQDELRRVQEGLGDIRRLDPLTQNEIDTQVGRYRSVAQDSYNEVIEQMASMNEADLRRRGIAATDPGDTRSRMAQRLADDLAATQMQAEQQALAYISGERGLLFDDIQQDIATRNAILGETANVGLAGFDQRRNLMNTLPTANVAAPVPLGTSVLQQRFSSANANAPVAINSAQFTGQLPSAIGTQLNAPSAVQGGFRPPTEQVMPSSATNMSSQILSNLQNGYASLGGAYEGRATTAMVNAQNYANRASDYGQSFGSSLTDLISGFEGREPAYIYPVDQPRNPQTGAYL